MPAVLLVTKDPSTGELAERALGNGGYEVVRADSADSAIRTMFSVEVDALVLDSVLGREQVEGICRWVRESNGTLRIVFLASAGTAWLPGALPVERGVDEVVVKPFSPREIRQAVERALAAANRARPNVMLIGSLELDRTTHEVRGEDGAVTLTPTEFRLMEYLAQRQGSIVSSEELLEKVWEFYPGTGSSELVRSHMRNLRSKLRVAVAGREVIQTVPRRGYRLVG